MTATEFKKVLHNAIDKADEKVLMATLSQTMFKNKGKRIDFQSLTPEQLASLMEELMVLAQYQYLFLDPSDSGNETDVTLPGKPFTEEELKKRILTAREDVKNGHFTTHEELKREMQSW